MSRLCTLLLAALMTATACSTPPAQDDAASTDAARPDSSVPDMGGTLDASVQDAGADGGITDAGLDGGALDAGIDASLDDTGTDGGALAAPRLIAPLSTSTVTSRRPTLHWVLTTGLDGARVEICRDRACTMLVTSIDASGTSARPAADLPTGVLFWRAFGRSGGATGASSSPTWEMFVPARSAAVDTSWGTAFDVDGDGLVDVGVGATGVSSNAGRVHIYLNGSSSLSTTASASIDGPDGAGAEFGVSVASAGDVNGDGFGDVLVGAHRALGGQGRVYLFFGGALGLDTTPTATLESPDAAGQRFGHVLSSAGDVDGDGYADFIVGNDSAATSNGRAHLYRGGPAPLATTPAVTFEPPDGSSTAFGGAVASAGDVNGDGFGDVIVGAQLASTGGRAYLYLGASSGLSAVPSTTLDGRDGANGLFGHAVSCAGDTNGDGYADIVVGAHGLDTNSGRAYVFLGSAAGVDVAPATTLIAPAGPAGQYFGFAVAGVGDVDGDGLGDVVIGSHGYSSATGRAYLHLGTSGGVSVAPAATLTGPDGIGSFYGLSVAAAGDIDQDGHADVLVGAYNATPTLIGRVHLYFGAAGGFATPPTTTTIESPDGDYGFFGAAIACSTEAPQTRLEC